MERCVEDIRKRKREDKRDNRDVEEERRNEGKAGKK